MGRQSGLRSLAALAAVVGATSAHPAWAFVTPTDKPSNLLESRSVAEGIRVIRPVTVQRSSLESSNDSSDFAAKSLTYDGLTGAPRTISGLDLVSSVVSVGADLNQYLAVAQQYIDTYGARLGITMADLELNKKATLLGKDNQFLKFRVYRNGLVVQDAGVDFRFKKGRLVQVVNQSFSEANVSSDAQGDAAALLRRAGEAVIGDVTSRERDVYRVVGRERGYELVRVTEFSVRDQQDLSYLVQVAAATGEVFEVRPTTFYIDGQASGNAYKRYYGDRLETVPYANLEVMIGSQTVQTDVSGRFFGGGNSYVETQGFTGEKVRIVPKTGPKDVLTAEQQGSRWVVSYEKGSDPAPEDKGMSQSMVYVHLNKVINLAKKYIEADWLNEQITANVNLPQSCNAFWDGSTVNFFSAGKGCANTGLIADVVYHEWGHGLDHNTGGIDDGALSEGLGDIVALVITGEPVVGGGFKTADGAGVRDLQTFKVYPKDQSGDPHKEGLIIGGALWDLLKELRSKYSAEKASDYLAQYVFNVMFTAAKYTDVYDALLVIDSGDGDPSRASPNLCLINRAFVKHGLAKVDSRCRG